MMVRRLLEPPAMPLVVAWATAADLDEMDRCLAGGDHAASYEEFESWDLALHRCIMRPAAARCWPRCTASSSRPGTATCGATSSGAAPRQRRQEYQADHREIVAALRVRDSAAAVEAMRVHLARVSNHLLGEAH